MPLPPLPVEPDFKVLGARLKALRTERGLSHEALAERSTVARRTLLDMEAGRYGGRLRSWSLVAQGLDVPLSSLVSVLDAPA